MNQTSKVNKAIKKKSTKVTKVTKTTKKKTPQSLFQTPELESIEKCLIAFIERGHSVFKGDTCLRNRGINPLFIAIKEESKLMIDFLLRHKKYPTWYKKLNPVMYVAMRTQNED